MLDSSGGWPWCSPRMPMLRALYRVVFVCLLSWYLAISRFEIVKLFFAPMIMIQLCCFSCEWIRTSLAAILQGYCERPTLLSSFILSCRLRRPPATGHGPHEDFGTQCDNINEPKDHWIKLPCPFGGWCSWPTLFESCAGFPAKNWPC